MALTKCSECGGEVSDKATICPHCGNPIVANTISAPQPTSAPIESKSKDSFSIKRVLTALPIGIGVVVILFGIGFLFPNQVSAIGAFILRLPTMLTSSSQTTITTQNGGVHYQTVNVPINQSATPQAQPAADPLAVQTNNGATFYPVQQVNLWGYSFYTSKIDGSGSIDIGSNAKQTIAELLNQIGYPHPMTTNLAIINADPTLMQPNEYIPTPYAGNVPVAISSQPEGGLYEQVGIGSSFTGAIIYMNSSNNWDLAVLTHELGHQIGFHMTDAQWTQYYTLRGIPANTPRQTNNWYTSPEEDFAEVFKATYAQGNGGEWAIRTNYGPLISTNDLYDVASPCYQVEQTVIQNSLHAWEQENSSIFMVPTDVMNQFQSQAQYDPKVQACRQTDTTQSPFGGPLYTRTAGPATQQFVKSVVAGLNKTVAVATSTPQTTPSQCVDFQKQEVSWINTLNMAQVYPPNISKWSGNSTTTLYQVFYSKQKSACFAGAYTVWNDSNGNVIAEVIEITTPQAEYNNSTWVRSVVPVTSVSNLESALQSAINSFEQNGSGPT